MISNIAKSSLYTKILIDFNCYVDIDVGLIRLIQKEYTNNNVFKKSLVNLDIKEIISLLYNRTVVNPLYLFANENISYDDLDEYYRQFLETKKKEILSLSISTELKSLISLFKSDGNIHIDFLCKDENEISLLKSESILKDCNFIINSDEIDPDKYFQFYFKYVSDSLEKYIAKYKTYYFSTCRLNFNESGEELIYLDIIDKIIFNRSEINIIDLYNNSLISKGVLT